jgi:hypothetical protein
MSYMYCDCVSGDVKLIVYKWYVKKYTHQEQVCINIKYF